MSILSRTNQRVPARDRPTSADNLKDVSDATRCDADLTSHALWLRYFELGGMRTPAEVESYLGRGVTPSVHDHDVLAQALNERFSELGISQRVRLLGNPPTREASSPSPTGKGMQLGLLSAFSVHVDAERMHLPMNAQRLVSYLAIHDGALLRKHVSGSLWGDVLEHRASGSLRSALSRLGQLRHPLIDVADQHLRLSSNVSVDVRASDALARRILDDSQDLSEADLNPALLSTDVLPDWTEDWVLIRREHHTQLRLRALEALCGRLSDMGRFGQAVQTGMLAVSVEPLRESAQRALISAHMAQGNLAAAAKQYDSFREILRDELNLKPSEEMQAMVKRLRR